MYKFCHCLTKPIITRIIVSLVFKNVIIRIEVTVFRGFIILYVQILVKLLHELLCQILFSLVKFNHCLTKLLLHELLCL